MNPNPFSVLNHFTVPFAITEIPSTSLNKTLQPKDIIINLNHRPTLTRYHSPKRRKRKREKQSKTRRSQCDAIELKQRNIYLPAMMQSNLDSLSTPTILLTNFSNPAFVAAEHIPTYGIIKRKIKLRTRNAKSGTSF